MKIPRDISGLDLAKLLSIYGYFISRQSGSHLRLSTRYGVGHHITIPAHSSLRTGTLSAILSEISAYLKKDKAALIKELFG